MACFIAWGLVAEASAQSASAPEPEATSSTTIEPKAKQSRRPRYHLRAHVTQSYTSNLFHEQNRRLDRFTELDGRAERYEGMSGPSDLVTEPGLAGGVAFKLGKHRKLAFELGGTYALHARNGIANYLTLEAEAEYELGKRDRLRYQASFVPTRFKKNYPYESLESLNQVFFERADYLKLENELAYRHRWNKRAKSEVGVALSLERFDAPFENRNSNEYAAMLETGYAPVKLLEITLGLDLALTRTPADHEYRSIPVDRSHHDIEPRVELAFDFPSRLAAMLGFGTRFRQYETSVTDDSAYFNRHDRRLTFEGEVSKGLGKHFEVALEAAYVDNNAYRADPTDNPDDYGYQEVRVGLSLAALLD